MLRYRLIFGSIMMAALVGVFYFDDQLDQINIRGTWLGQLFPNRSYLPAGLLLLASFMVLIALGSKELCAIFRAKGVPANPVMVAMAGIVGLMLIYTLPHTLDSQTTMAIFASLMVLVFVATLVEHSWLGRTEGAVLVAGVTMFALIYMGLLPGFYLAIRRWHSAWVIAAIMIVTKSCDIGAYFTGLAIGRHRLIPWLSPAKTWEGLLGGVAFSAITAVGLAALLNGLDLAGVYTSSQGQRVFNAYHYPLWAAAAAGVLIGAVGQFGDLCASLFKRDAGVKDAGSTIPGFGGVLDIVDSPIVVAPVAYWLLALARLAGQEG